MSVVAIFGLVFLGVAAVLFLGRGRQLAQVAAMRATETATVAGLEQLWSGVRQDLGAEPLFRTYVELKGVIRCARPLTAELSHQPCVYYETRVTQRYERRNSKGEYEDEEEEIARSSQRTAFMLEDATGSLTVDPQGAEIEGMEVVNRTEPGTPGNILTVGGKTLELAERSRARSQGFELHEYALPLETSVYVLGEAADIGGKLIVRAPAEGEKPFLITYKSEEQAVKDKERNALFLAIAAAVCVVVGLGLIVLAFTAQ